MPDFLLDLSNGHVSELRDRFGPTAVDEVGELRLREADREETALYEDRSRSVDRFIRTCVGTALRLEEHQAAGGTIFLGFADGSLRQITLDLDAAEGRELPRTSSLTSRQARALKRRARQ